MHFKTKLVVVELCVILQCIEKASCGKQDNVYYPQYSPDNLTIDSDQFAIKLLTKWTPAKPIAEYNVYSYYSSDFLSFTP